MGRTKDPRAGVLRSGLQILKMFPDSKASSTTPTLRDLLRRSRIWFPSWFTGSRGRRLVIRVSGEVSKLLRPFFEGTIKVDLKMTSGESLIRHIVQRRDVRTDIASTTPVVPLQLPRSRVTSGTPVKMRSKIQLHPHVKLKYL